MAQVAVIGLGRFGFHVARQLHLAGHDVLAIDIDSGNVQQIRDFSSRAVVLDARDKERLDALVVFPEREAAERLAHRLAIRDVLTQEIHLNPGAERTVKPSDALLILGRDQDLARLKQA